MAQPRTGKQQRQGQKSRVHNQRGRRDEIFSCHPPITAPLPSKQRGLLSSLSFQIPLNGAERGKKTRERERESVCVCERERERESVCVCVCVLWVSKSRKPYKKTSDNKLEGRTVASTPDSEKLHCPKGSRPPACSVDKWEPSPPWPTGVSQLLTEALGGLGSKWFQGKDAAAGWCSEVWGWEGRLPACPSGGWQAAAPHQVL